MTIQIRINREYRGYSYSIDLDFQTLDIIQDIGPIIEKAEWFIDQQFPSTNPKLDYPDNWSLLPCPLCGSTLVSTCECCEMPWCASCRQHLDPLDYLEKELTESVPTEPSAEVVGDAGCGGYSKEKSQIPRSS